jgi:hypothetical protein
MTASVATNGAMTWCRLLPFVSAGTTRLQDGAAAWFWMRASSRAGLAWLNDLLPTRTSAARMLGPVWDRTCESTALFAGSGMRLSALLDDVDSTFVQDILVRRAASAMAQLHRQGGYLGYARADHIEVLGNEVCFAQADDEEFEAMNTLSLQVRDWLQFTASVAHHYRERVDDLTTILYRTLPMLGSVTRDALRLALDRLAFLESPWLDVLGWRMRALRVSVQAMRRSLTSSN